MSSAAVCEQEVLTFVSDDLGGLEEEAAVLQVHHLSLKTILHHIHQSQLVSQVLSRGGGEMAMCQGYTLTFPINQFIHLNFDGNDAFYFGILMSSYVIAHIQYMTNGFSI